MGTKQRQIGSYQKSEGQHGKHMYKAKAIEKVLVDFYESIYAEKDIDQVQLDKLKSRLNPNLKLTKKQKEELGMEISIEEVEKYIKYMAKRKAPGPDGIRAEVYQLICSEISPILHRLYNYIGNTGDIPEDWNGAHIRLILKKGKDPEDPGS